MEEPDITYSNDRSFDFKLSKAKVNERKLAEILAYGNIENGVSFELKTETYQWEETGNFCIEYSQDGEPSGIAATEADYWAHELKRGGETLTYFLTPMPRMKALFDKYRRLGPAYRRRYRDKDNRGVWFECVLIPYADILLPLPLV